MSTAKVVIQAGKNGVILPIGIQRLEQFRGSEVGTRFNRMKIFWDKAIENPGSGYSLRRS